MTPEERLAELGITLPTPPTPVAAYVPFVVSGNQVWVAGQLPMVDGKLTRAGTVGVDISVDDATADARVCALNVIAVIKAAAGELSRVRRVVKLNVFVASSEGFHAQPSVANGASELFAEVFGDAGRHARASVGVAQLPLGAPVEVDAVVELEE